MSGAGKGVKGERWQPLRKNRGQTGSKGEWESVWIAAGLNTRTIFFAILSFGRAEQVSSPTLAVEVEWDPLDLDIQQTLSTVIYLRDNPQAALLNTPKSPQPTQQRAPPRQAAQLHLRVLSATSPCLTNQPLRTEKQKHALPQNSKELATQGGLGRPGGISKSSPEQRWILSLGRVWAQRLAPVFAHVPGASWHTQQSSTWPPAASRAAASCLRGQYQDLAREDKIQILKEIINAYMHHTEIRHSLPSRSHRRAAPCFFPWWRSASARGEIFAGKPQLHWDRTQQLPDGKLPVAFPHQRSLPKTLTEQQACPLQGKKQLSFVLGGAMLSAPRCWSLVQQEVLAGKFGTVV